MTQMILISDLVDWSIRATLLLAVGLLIGRMLEFRSATIAHRMIVAMFAGILMFMQTLLCFIRLRKFVDNCSPAAAGLVDQIGSLARRSGLKRRVCVLVSEADRMPMACWLRRWTIVVPENLITWPRELQETTLLHELGHIARRDAWSDLLARSVVCLLWPSPIVWIAARQTRRLRERACDEWSLQNSGFDAKQYALSLVEVVQRCQGPVQHVASAMADTRGFEARLKWLVTAARPQRSRRFSGGSVLLGVLAVVIVVATAAPNRTTRGGEQEQRVAADAETPAVVANREPSPAQPSISVAGTVTDPSGQPLAGATVALYADLIGQSVHELRFYSDRSLLATTNTDDRGRFRFTRIAIPPRMGGVIEELQRSEPAARVVTWAQGYAVQWQMVQAFDAADQEFRLPPQADVSGIVVDEHFNPLTEAELVVAGLTSDKDNLDSFVPRLTSHGVGAHVAEFRAAVRDGRFSLANMPKDHHIVVHCRSRTGHWAAYLIDTGDDTTGEAYYQDRQGNIMPVHRTPIRATARQYPRVRLSVLDHQGKTVTDGGFNALDANGRSAGSARIGADGIGVLTVPEPGVHRVIYSTDIGFRRLGFSQSVVVQPGDPETVVMQLPQPYWIAGKVIDGDTGEPIPGVPVTVEPAQDEETERRVTGAKSVTGMDGRFELPTTEGPQYLWLTEDVYGYFTPTYQNSEHVAVTPDFPVSSVASDSPELTVSAEHVPRDLVIRIARGLVVDGRVLDPQGRPEQNARVMAISEAPLNRQKVVYTDAEGRFRFTGLSPHVLTRIATVTDSGAAEQEIAAAAEHPWEKSRRESVTLRITPKTSLVGRVIRQGEPAANIKVSLRRAQSIGGGASRYRVWDETVTDDQGRYRLRGLSEGDRFEVEIERPVTFLVSDLRRPSRFSQTLDVEDGSTIEIPDAELVSTD